jgi:hypothetical protein
MHPRQHALLARQLISACGGLVEAAEHCRLKKSRLSDFQDPIGADFMTADVIADLEAYCGEPIYSRALMEARPSAQEAKGLMVEACELTEGVAAFQKLARQAAKDGRISAVERGMVEEGLLILQQKISVLQAATERGRS